MSHDAICLLTQLASLAERCHYSNVSSFIVLPPFLPNLLCEEELRRVGVGGLLLLRRRHLVQAAVVLRPRVGVHRHCRLMHPPPQQLQLQHLTTPMNGCSGGQSPLSLTGVSAVRIARQSTSFGASGGAHPGACSLPVSGTHHTSVAGRVRVVIVALRVAVEHPVVVGMGQKWTESWSLRSAFLPCPASPPLCLGR